MANNLDVNKFGNSAHPTDSRAVGYVALPRACLPLMPLTPTPSSLSYMS